MKTIESNRLIAEFMGGVPYHNNTPELINNNGMLFHSSWDWLMPVVHKCLGICHDEELNEWEVSFSDKLFTCHIEPMYKEVVEFIKWYNQQ